MSHLFAYGTLIVPSVMQAVAGMNYEHVSASLDGYARFKVKNKTYPAIIKDENAMVDGVLYLNIDEEALKRLDYFESKEYERVIVKVELEGGKRVNAYAYVISPAHENVLVREPWNLKNFKEKEADSYLKRAREIMRQYS